MCVSAATNAPGSIWCTSGPTDSTWPATSWPNVIGTRGMRFCAHSFQSKMCRSVPQIEVACTRTRTSPSPGAGTATSESSAPGRASVLRRARIVVATAGAYLPVAGTRSRLTSSKPTKDRVARQEDDEVADLGRIADCAGAPALRVRECADRRPRRERKPKTERVLLPDGTEPCGGPDRIRGRLREPRLRDRPDPDVLALR